MFSFCQPSCAVRGLASRWRLGCPGVVHSVDMSDFLEGCNFDFPTYRFYFKSVSDVLHVDFLFLHRFRGCIAFVAPDVLVKFVSPVLHGIHVAVFSVSRCGVKKETELTQLSLVDYCLWSFAEAVFFQLGFKIPP